MKIKILILLFLFKLNFFAQQFSAHKIALTPTLIPATNFNEEAYKNKFYAKFSNEPRSTDLDNYIKKDAFAKKYFFLSNQIYTNWSEATDYVKQVFSISVPKQFNTSDVKIYVVRDPSPNAYCMEDGDIAVTVGFLAYMNNEAQLAAALSHEFGHYYSNHLYNDYKKLNNNKTLKKIIRFKSAIGGLIITQNQFNYRQDQEREADTFAFNFFTKNGYSPSSIAETYAGFEKLTNKYKKLDTYRQPLLYFSSHPTNQERISNAKTAFKNKNSIGKQYLVDSVSFSAIKKRATDETIYLLFDNMEYDECLEMAYLQYLYYPDDEFYLFFITECLRRQMMFEEDFAEKLFITDNYKNLTQPVPFIQKMPVFLKGKYSKKLNLKNFSKSIYANLQNEIYHLSKQELKAIKAPEIIKKDTLEFLFNEDALAYFSGKIKKSSCVFNLGRAALNQPLTDNCESGSANSEIENYYLQAAPLYQKIKLNVSKYKRSPVILSDVKLYSVIGEEMDKPFLLEDVLAQYDSVASVYAGNDTLDAKNKFNFREYQRIKNISNFIEMLGVKNEFSKRLLDCDFLSVLPEYAYEINKFNYDKLLFVDLHVYGVSDGTKTLANIYGMQTERWAFEIYVVDLVYKKIERQGFTIPAVKENATRENKINFILNECFRISAE